MTEILAPILIALVLAAASPLAVHWSAQFVEAGRRKRAYRRLEAEPTVYVGAELREIQLPGRDKPVCGRCVVHAIDVGRLEVRCIEVNTGQALSIVFTGREFEDLIPVAAVT